jgi:hypothetical protein
VAQAASMERKSVNFLKVRPNHIYTGIIVLSYRILDLLGYEKRYFLPKVDLCTLAGTALRKASV